MNKTFTLIVSVVFTTTFHSQAFAQEVSHQQNECKRVLTCIIKNSESILKNLHQRERAFASTNHKLVHSLAKKCKSTKTKIGAMITLLRDETGIMPNHDSVQNYLKSQLTGDIENEKVIDGTATIENEDFTTKLYVEGYKKGMKLQSIIVHDIEYMRRNPIARYPSLEKVFSEISGKTKLENWWFGPESIFYGFMFEASSPRHTFPQGYIEGILILERPLDYYTITEECAEGK